MVAFERDTKASTTAATFTTVVRARRPPTPPALGYVETVSDESDSSNGPENGPSTRSLNATAPTGSLTVITDSQPPSSRSTAVTSPSAAHTPTTDGWSERSSNASNPPTPTDPDSEPYGFQPRKGAIVCYSNQKSDGSTSFTQLDPSELYDKLVEHQQVLKAPMPGTSESSFGSGRYHVTEDGDDTGYHDSRPSFSEFNKRLRAQYSEQTSANGQQSQVDPSEYMHRDLTVNEIAGFMIREHNKRKETGASSSNLVDWTSAPRHSDPPDSHNSHSQAKFRAGRKTADEYLNPTNEYFGVPSPPYTEPENSTLPCTDDRKNDLSRGTNDSVNTGDPLRSLRTSRSGGSSAWARQRDCSCPIGRTCKFCADVCSSVASGISTGASFAWDLMTGKKHVTSSIMSGTAALAKSGWSATKAGYSSVAESSFGRSVGGMSAMAVDTGRYMISKTGGYLSRRGSEMRDGVRLLVGAEPLQSYTGREESSDGVTDRSSGKDGRSVFSRFKSHLKGGNCSTRGGGADAYSLI